MKKMFEQIELTIVMLDEDDVLRTSGEGEEETLPPVNDENQGEWT